MDKVHSYNPLTTLWRGIKNSSRIWVWQCFICTDLPCIIFHCSTGYATCLCFNHATCEWGQFYLQNIYF